MEKHWFIPFSILGLKDEGLHSLLEPLGMLKHGCVIMVSFR